MFCVISLIAHFSLPLIGNRTTVKQMSIDDDARADWMSIFKKVFTCLTLNYSTLYGINYGKAPLGIFLSFLIMEISEARVLSQLDAI